MQASDILIAPKLFSGYAFADINTYIYSYIDTYLDTYIHAQTHMQPCTHTYMYAYIKR